MNTQNNLIEMAKRIKDALSYYKVFIYEKSENIIVRELIKKLGLDALVSISEIVRGKHLLLLEPNIRPCISECTYECRNENKEKSRERCIKACIEKCKEERLQHIKNVLESYISGQGG